MLQIKKFVFNPFFENTYLVWDDETKEASIIDPGCNEHVEHNFLKDFIRKENLNLVYTINTHCHIDHVLGNSFIKNEFGTKLLIPKEEMPLFDLMVEQANAFGINYTSSPAPDEYISEENKIMLGNKEGRFLFTPGHSPGGYCLYFEEDKVCFSGDVLFHESIGRTDLWGGNYETLINSIKTKLFTLPDDVRLFPGHESETTVGYEKSNNPFIKD